MTKPMKYDSIKSISTGYACKTVSLEEEVDIKKINIHDKNVYFKGFLLSNRHLEFASNIVIHYNGTNYLVSSKDMEYCKCLLIERKFFYENRRHCNV